MRIPSRLALLLAAIGIAKILSTALGLLIALIPIVFQLPPAESALRHTYLVAIGYSSVVVTLSVFTGYGIYMQATSRDVRRLARWLTLVTLCLYGLHVTYAYAINLNNEVLARFLQGFVWLSAIASLSSAGLLVVSWFDRQASSEGPDTPTPPTAN